MRSTSIDFVYDGNPRGYFRESNRVQHVTNRAGFRGPDFELAKKDSTVRVLFLGDSFTFGEGVYFEDTYPEQFRSRATSLALFGPRRIEAINLGVGGYNTSQEWSLLAVSGPNLNPDAIVVGYVLNDAEGRLFSHGEGGRLQRNPSTFSGWILPNADSSRPRGSLRIVQAVRVLLNASKRSALTDSTVAYYKSLYDENRTEWQATRDALARIAEFGRQRKIPVLVVVFPELFHLRSGYPFQGIHDKVHAELKRLGVHEISVLDELAGRYDGPELWVHPTDRHPNEIVHRVVAEALVRKFAGR